MAEPDRTVQTVQSGGARERWLEALEQLMPVPPGFREEVVDRVAALDVLRCGEEMLDELVRQGLPCSGPPGAELFDRHDLFNLGLHSGSAASVPELAMGFALRWMSKPPAALLQAARWTFRIEITCGRDDGCGTAPRWTLARPLPEVTGGHMEALTVHPATARTRAIDVEALGGHGLGLSGTVETRGRAGEIRSRRVRDVVGDFLAQGYRWARLPEVVQHRFDEVLAHGVAPCISASLKLQEELRAAGYEVRTRRGWMLGMLDLGHSWLEVTDDDGEVKVVDPIFALLSGYARDPHPRFAAACVGWRFNRVLPTPHSADQPLVGHVCGGRPARYRQKTEVRKAPEEVTV